MLKHRTIAKSLARAFALVGAVAVGSVVSEYMVGAAFAQTSGGPTTALSIEVGGGWLFTSHLKDGAEQEIEDHNFGLTEGAIRFSIPLGSRASIQFDADGMLTFADDDNKGNGDNHLENFYFGTVHLTWRDPATGALGVFASYGESDGSSNDISSEDVARVWFGGGEVQVYIGDLTLYLQGGLMDADDGSENDVVGNAIWGRGVARYFVSADTRLQAEVAYMIGEEEDDAPGDTYVAWGWGARLDQSFGDTPLSYLIAYRGTSLTEIDSGKDDRLIDHTALLGLVLTLGPETLGDQDRRGATLDTPAWAIGRWTGWSIDVVD